MSYGANKPWGLQPARYFNGAAWNDQVTPYQILPGYAPGGGVTGVFRGDPATAAAGATGTLTLATAGAGNAILGVFWGFQWLDPVTGENVFSEFLPSGQQTFNPSAANPNPNPITAFVIDDPMVVYNIQGDGNGGAGITTAMLLRNADLVAGAGASYNSLSGWMLSQATVGTAANKQVKIIRFVPTVEGTNVTALQYNNVEVVINNHYYKAGVLSV